MRGWRCAGGGRWALFNSLLDIVAPLHAGPCVLQCCGMLTADVRAAFERHATLRLLADLASTLGCGWYCLCRSLLRSYLRCWPATSPSPSHPRPTTPTSG